MNAAFARIFSDPTPVRTARVKAGKHIGRTLHVDCIIGDSVICLVDGEYETLHRGDVELVEAAQKQEAAHAQ